MAQCSSPNTPLQAITKSSISFFYETVLRRTTKYFGWKLGLITKKEFVMDWKWLEINHELFSVNKTTVHCYNGMPHHSTRGDTYTDKNL